MQYVKLFVKTLFEKTAYGCNLISLQAHYFIVYNVSRKIDSIVPALYFRLDENVQELAVELVQLGFISEVNS